MSAQLVLPIGVDDTQGLDNFLPGSNQRLFEHLQQSLQQRLYDPSEGFAATLIWGDSGCGKTHLLIALVEWFRQRGGKVSWIESPASPRPEPELSSSRLLYLLDAMDAQLDGEDAERQMLTLIEQIRQQGAVLLMTSRQPVRGLGIHLPDLASRLQAFETLELLALDDEDKREVLCNRARQRGFELSDDVLAWLYHHATRDMGALLDLLERIDIQSLSQQRKVTIPLIKSILDE